MHFFFLFYPFYTSIISANDSSFRKGQLTLPLLNKDNNTLKQHSEMKEYKAIHRWIHIRNIFDKFTII
ncbi:hypothetical protein M072_1544 [Bacteroides fragilis str. DS-208]|nr:hypothetical protein M072_1544 [Bacteroides fragilis str. DS-208]